MFSVVAWLLRESECFGGVFGLGVEGNYLIKKMKVIKILPSWLAWIQCTFKELYIIGSLTHLSFYKIERAKHFKITSNSQSGGFHEAQKGCVISPLSSQILCPRFGGTRQ